MGIAILIPDMDFSNENIGQLEMNDDLQGIMIRVKPYASIVGYGYQFVAMLNPVTTETSQRGISWSIESGNEYASIDSQTGYLSINMGVSNAPITIKATSTYDSNIYAQVSVYVTNPYVNAVFTDTAMYNFSAGTYEGTRMSGGWHSTSGINVEGGSIFRWRTTKTSADKYGNFSAVMFFSTSNVNTNPIGPGVIKSMNGTFETPIPAGVVSAVIMNCNTTSGVTYTVDE